MGKPKIVIRFFIFLTHILSSKNHYHLCFRWFSSIRLLDCHSKQKQRSVRLATKPNEQTPILITASMPSPKTKPVLCHVTKNSYIFAYEPFLWGSDHWTWGLDSIRFTPSRGDIISAAGNQTFGIETSKSVTRSTWKWTTQIFKSTKTYWPRPYPTEKSFTNKNN